MPEQGSPVLKDAEFPGGQALSSTVTWYQQLLRALRQHDVAGLSVTNPDQLNAVKPGRRNKEQPLQERFLALAKTVEATPAALRSDRYEEDAGPLLTEMLDGFGFCSPLSRDAGARAVEFLAGYTGREVAEHLATVTVWHDDCAGRLS